MASSFSPDQKKAEDDAEVQSLRDGDLRATETFVRNHAPWMLALARRILKDEAQAENAVQNAFASVFQNLDSFEGRSAPKTWIHKIVVNQALMLLRKRNRLQEEPIDDLMPVFDENGCRFEDPWTVLETPETIFQQSQAQKHISALIDQLPDAYRVVLILRDIEEMSTADVADALSLSEANMKVRLHRARAALKRLLEPLLRGDAI